MHRISPSGRFPGDQKTPRHPLVRAAPARLHRLAAGDHAGGRLELLRHVAAPRLRLRPPEDRRHRHRLALSDDGVELGADGRDGQSRAALRRGLRLLQLRLGERHGHGRGDHRLRRAAGASPTVSTCSATRAASISAPPSSSRSRPIRASSAGGPRPTSSSGCCEEWKAGRPGRPPRRLWPTAAPSRRGTAYGCVGRRRISVRRFCARPSGVSFDATG